MGVRRFVHESRRNGIVLDRALVAWLASAAWLRSVAPAAIVAAALGIAWDSLANASVASPTTPRQRGEGIPTSMFGTYIRPGELLVYPFFEYYLNNDEEYKPEELGFGLERDFRGKYRASEGLIFLSYGISDRWAIEIEAAVISAKLEKAADDPSAMPDELKQSGTGDVEGQLRYRWAEETEGRPELFSYFEAVTPQQKDKKLIGTPDWELKLGFGAIKEYPLGTFTLRAAGEYDAAESKGELGECALEYLRVLSPAWRGYLGLEGAQDEWELITEAQWKLHPRATLKLNNAFGVTSKAVDWAPEVGVMFSFPSGRSGSGE